MYRYIIAQLIPQKIHIVFISAIIQAQSELMLVVADPGEILVIMYPQDCTFTAHVHIVGGGADGSGIHIRISADQVYG